MDETIVKFVGFYANPGVSIWLLVILLIVIALWIFLKYFKTSAVYIFFELIFEKIFEFFEDILWVEEKNWIKVYVTILFFIILFSNLFGVFLEFLLPIFGHHMEEYIKIPSSDINFNVAMSLIWLSIIIIEQFRALGLKKALYEYFPIFWKEYIPYSKWNLPKIIDIPLFTLVKIFDIFISMFLWILEIVGHIAKIISLSFRLFWNVTSGWILLWMLFAALSALSVKVLGFDFPIIWPVIVYFQEILVALIQALVFPLLISIFIKVVKLH